MGFLVVAVVAGNTKCLSYDVSSKHNLLMFGSNMHSETSGPPASIHPAESSKHVALQL